MNIFQNQNYIPLQDFIKYSCNFFGSKITAKDIAKLLTNELLHLYIRTSGSNELLSISNTLIDNPCIHINDYHKFYEIYSIAEFCKILKYKKGENILVSDENGSFTGKLIINKGELRDLISKNNYITIENYLAKTEEQFLFQGFFLLDLGNLFLKYQPSEIEIYLENFISGNFDNSKKLLSDYILELEIHNFKITLYLELNLDLNILDEAYISTKEIDRLLKEIEYTNPLNIENSKLSQYEKEILYLKNKLAYDGNPTEINSLKSIIFGLLHILDPSRPIDRRYLTKAGRLNISKLSRDIDEFLKNVSLEEIKKVSNRTIRNHFSNIIKSKAS
ncbi:hypothetical protein [Avibacterium paragallinarum]|uniref:hypothetical protein n=1 Tax=Avibacterium paragallinarum TaxID=728 RepID=UPI00397A52F8